MIAIDRYGVIINGYGYSWLDLVAGAANGVGIAVMVALGVWLVRNIIAKTSKF